MMFPKTAPVRDKKYLRAVASLPCIKCGIEGHSQAAHGPTLGRGIKSSDRDAFPLCCARPGVIGCHAEFDQYRGYTADGRRMMAATWSAVTRTKLETLEAKV